MISIDPTLVKAAQAGDLAAVQNIINSWTDDNRRCGYARYTPALALLIALEYGYDDIVNWLIDSKNIDLDALQSLYPNTTVKLTDAQKAFLAKNNLPVERRFF